MAYTRGRKTRTKNPSSAKVRALPPTRSSGSLAGGTSFVPTQNTGGRYNGSKGKPPANPSRPSSPVGLRVAASNASVPTHVRATPPGQAKRLGGAAAGPGRSTSPTPATSRFGERVGGTSTGSPKTPKKGLKR